MSWLFSRALVEACKPQEPWGGEQSAQSSRTNTPAMYLSHGKTGESLSLSRYGTMCEPLTDCLGEELLTSFRADSLVRTYQPREKEQELTAREADSGARWRGLLKKSSLDISLSKTHHCFYPVGLMSCLTTFPRWGLMHAGGLWAHTMLAHRTKESGYGYWATPTTEQGGIASDETLTRIYKKEKRASGHGIQLCLKDQVRDGRLWATPTVCGNHNRKGASATSGDGLATQVAHYKAEKDERLNPDWVEWLMGWSIGWSGLDTCKGGIGFEADPADSGDIPRVTLEKKHRAKRLCAIGNGQVPQCAYLAWVVLNILKRKFK